MTEQTVLLIGTKRGLFVIDSSDGRRTWRVSEPKLAGHEVLHATLDPRDGSAWAATTHPVWGAHIHRSMDRGATWSMMPSAPHHDDERGVNGVWFIAPGHVSQPGTLFAAIEPAGLFVTHDTGASWNAVESFNDHETRATWQPAGGALAAGSVLIDPRDPGAMYCAVAAGGAYRTDDAGVSWKPINAGTRADFLPERYPVSGQCVHKMLLHPARPDRLYQQNHCGVYRSDDRGDTWVEITADLPSDYGYVLAIDPRDADIAYVIPEDSSHMRTVAGAKLAVYRTANAGASWDALTRGLPQEHAYVSLLRECMAEDGRDPLGIYFGTSSGHVFGSIDGGASWQVVAELLPRVLSVTAFAFTAD